mmetsp:Transcript_4811/g.13869  ORF Transcript_4811/g.13869 Transcript_4811/m.13869 type:complete len:125 (+) Transcript_4811:42-416(+)
MFSMASYKFEDCCCSGKWWSQLYILFHLPTRTPSAKAAANNWCTSGRNPSAKPNRTPIKNKTKEPISSRQLADFSSSALASIAKKKIQSARTLLHVHKLEDSSSCRLVWIGFDAHQSAQSERNS